MPQYDAVAGDYSKMHAADPIKVFAQYPTVLNLLGNVDGKLVLDIGCGDGVLARMLAKLGAGVVGFDISEKQVGLARSLSAGFPNVQYFVSSPKDFSFPQKFDAAFAAMVLCYSRDYGEFESFFSSAFAALKEKGFLVVVDLDKSLLVYEKELFSRTFHKLPSGKIRLGFNIPFTTPFSVELTGFTKADFESAAKKAGFSSVQWRPVAFTPEGENSVSKAFFNEYRKLGFWIAGVFQK